MMLMRCRSIFPLSWQRGAATGDMIECAGELAVFVEFYSVTNRMNIQLVSARSVCGE